MEDDEYKKLPIEDRCVHKLWKARVNGYEEVTKLFRTIDDEKSPEFSKYLGLVKKFVVDSNAMGQEKGLEATLAYVENYVHAGKTASEVMSGIVLKCVAAPKTKTRELALQLILMYIEIEKQEAVMEELIKGMEQKNPKIVSACVSAATTGLKEFGNKIINVKPLVKKIPVLFADRDKTVRDEARQMTIELYRWIGPALKGQLNALQPVQVTELEAEFAKLDGKKVTPTRYVRSQQQKQAKLAMEAEEADNGGGDDDDQDDAPQEMDPYDLADPVDILSKLPKDFYEKVEAKKWQERKEALEALENLLKTPKLENGDYGDVVRALKKMIQKDSNVIVVALAARCLAMLATGLKKRFHTYSSACVSALLEKFKEKKQNVVLALRDAIDATYLSTNIEAILEDILEALGNKNPSVKSETSLFLARAFTKTVPTAVNKKTLKALTGALTKNINEPDPAVRESTAEALGTLMKLVGEKAMGPFLVDLEKDNLKMTKIKECFDKAVITVKIPGAAKKPASATESKTSVRSEGAVKAVVKKPASAPVKKKPDVSSGSATVTRSKAAAASKAAPKVVAKATVEKTLSDEEVDELVGNIITANVVGEMSSSNWKNRLAAMEQIMTDIQALEAKSIPAQALVKTIARKPGLKDTNFQVLKAKLDVIKYLAVNSKFSSTTADCCMTEIAEKFGDAKNGPAVCDVMTAIADAIGLGYVSENLMDFAFTQKSPKVMQETLIWLSNSIKDFGFSNLNIKVLIENSKKALASTNPQVRQSAISLLGTMYLYVGNKLNVFFENEKPALRDQINVEFDKYEGQKPPPPTRGVSKSASADSLDDRDDDSEPVQEVEVNVEDLIPRVDISNQITEALITEFSDKNWKTRNEAITKVSAIIQEAKYIKPGLGDLPQALAQRLTDSNVKIAQSSLSVCEAIAKAMGPPCKQYIRTWFPGCLQTLGDSKNWMRAASLDTINAFSEQCGYKEFFESEMIGDALKSGSPILRTELWGWLADKLPKIPVKSIPKDEVLVMVPHLFSNLEDRNADVRKNAQEAILGIMLHVGYEGMAKQAEKVKPASNKVIMMALEKVRPNMPVKPLPTKKSPTNDGDKAVRGTKAVGNSKNAVKPKAAANAKAGAAPSSRKKEEDIDLSPLLSINNMKHQRSIDEAKLKVLKWNFTQPREEFVDLLKDQMNAANVNKTLMANMFHSDFRYHIKAIESLSEDLPDNYQALISNLDLILKWLTLRFFDTNPSVLLKGLEYLHSVFNMLIDNEYHMVENEAASFIPYLVQKIGDPKDTVRNGVRSLFRQLCQVYTVSRLLTYIMDGIKSKNARQRAECLDAMSSIIENYGMTVCVPSPGACLKEVAKQISDRDNSVRSAALNCVVQAYNIVGERVYKMVGNISDKDMSMLEERIKRFSKKLPAPKPPKSDLNSTLVLNSSPVKNTSSPVRSNGNVAYPPPPEDEEEDDEYMEEEEDNIPDVTLPSQIQLIQPNQPEVVKGPFQLDPEFMKEMDKLTVEINSIKETIEQRQLTLKEFDLDFLKEEIKIPSLSDVRVKALQLSPPKPVEPTPYPTPTMPSIPTFTKKKETALEQNIKQMGSSDVAIASQSVAQMIETLNSNMGSTLIDYEDEFMTAIVNQFKNLKSKDPVENYDVSRLYRNILTLIDSFYQTKVLGRKVTIPVLMDLFSEMINLLVDGKLEKCASGDAYVRVINLHCVKVIDQSDHTNIICALIKLLQINIRNDNSPRHTDLIMKSIWRVLKLMPQWGDEIEFDAVLLEVHYFMKEFPSMWWKNKPSDVPLRTLKTMMHTSVKIKGPTIMLHLGSIRNTRESEVEAYLTKLLKTLNMEAPPKTETQHRSISKANHNMLTDIFQKIGSKETTKQGMQMLYEFMQQNPEADIDPFLNRSSKFFQDYIRNGLKEIEDSSKSAKHSISEKAAGQKSANINEVTSENTARGAEYWEERLNYWNSRWNAADNKD